MSEVTVQAETCTQGVNISNQLKISGLPDTWITPIKLYRAIVFLLFFCFNKSSPSSTDVGWTAPFKTLEEYVQSDQDRQQLSGNESLSLLLLSFKTLLKKKVWLARYLPFLIPFISAPSTCITCSRGSRQHKGPSIWNVNCTASQLRSESVCIIWWGTCSSFIASLGGTASLSNDVVYKELPSS